MISKKPRNSPTSTVLEKILEQSQQCQSESASSLCYQCITDYDTRRSNVSILLHGSKYGRIRENHAWRQVARRLLLQLHFRRPTERALAATWKYVQKYCDCVMNWRTSDLPDELRAVMDRPELFPQLSRQVSDVLGELSISSASRGKAGQREHRLLRVNLPMLLVYLAGKKVVSVKLH